MNLSGLRPFPLSGMELRELQDAIEVVAQHRSAAQAKGEVAGASDSWIRRLTTAPVLTKRTHSRATLLRARRSSLGLLVVLLSLAVVAVVNVLSVVLWIGAPPWLFAFINLAGVAVALVVWGRHHTDLRLHGHALHWLHR